MGLFGGTSRTSSVEVNETGDSFLYVGKEVLVKGTGRWWSGAQFKATIVDIRESDGTVKIRYIHDSGYKRLPKADLKGLLINQQGQTNFGTQSFEWYHDKYAPDEAVVNQRTEALEKLQGEIKIAVREGDFKKAHDIKKNFIETQKHFSQMENHRSELQQAVIAEEFLKADQIKKELEKIGKEGEQSKTIETDRPPLSETLAKAGKRALGGGLAGAGAMIIQVCTLMWMRTTMNYQYRYGTSTTVALKTLYAEGGIRRFYRGIAPGLIQGPLARFGDTAANAGFLALMDSSKNFSHLPTPVKTIGASACAASFRIFLTPVDTVKTILQVEGKKGLEVLFSKAKTGGPSVYFHGAMASAAATFVGHYPWFATFNTLQANIPVPEDRLKKLGRNAGIGFVSSVLSDTISNSLRVIKTYRQTNPEKISYTETINQVVAKDGYAGLFGRGLKTRILANGMQGVMFSVMWKHFEAKLATRM